MSSNVGICDEKLRSVEEPGNELKKDRLVVIGASSRWHRRQVGLSTLPRRRWAFDFQKLVFCLGLNKCQHREKKDEEEEEEKKEKERKRKKEEGNWLRKGLLPIFLFELVEAVDAV